MATRTPPFPLSPETAEIEAFDAIRRQEEVAGVTVADAERMAAEGDGLELALFQSGFYAPGGEADPDTIRAAVDSELSMRALGDFIVRLREASVERRWGVDEQTLLNFAFRAGHHYVEIDRGRRAVLPVPAPRDAVRRKVQKFEPWFKTQHSKLSSTKPSYQVKPTSKQQEDRDASSMGERIALWDNQVMHDHDAATDSAMWELLSGSAVLYSFVDYEFDPTYMPQPDPATGIPVPMPKPILRFKVLPPQLCWCDDRVATTEDMRWFGCDLPTVRAEAIASYPDKARLLDPELPGSDERGLLIHRRTQRMTTNEQPWREDTDMGQGGAFDEEEEVLLLEWYATAGTAIQIERAHGLQFEELDFEILDTGDVGRPVVIFPNGAHITLTTEGHILEAENNPYDGLPFDEVKVAKSPGFWTNAPASFLRELNMAINWALSLWEEHLLRTARPKELHPRQANVRRRSSLNAAQILRYRASQTGAKPEFMDPPTMPADGIRFFEVLNILWQDVSGVHEVSEGKIPASDISGVAIALLQEQDLAQLGFTGSEIEKGYARHKNKRLRMIQQYFPRNDPRLVRLAGDALYKLDAFMLSDLKDGLDIRVRPGSALPRSPAAVKAEAQEAWAGGFLVDKYGRPDHKRMLEVYQFGTAEELYAEDEANEQNARREEDLILRLTPQQAAMVLIFVQRMGGQLPAVLMPQPEDDHMVHELTHRMRLVQLRGDPRITPMHLAVLRIHWHIHLQAVGPILQLTDPAAALGAGVGQGGPQEEGAEEDGAEDEASSEEAA